MSIFTARKRSLGQGNIILFTGGGSLSQHASQVTWQGGLCPGQGLCPGGISVMEGLCPGVAIKGGGSLSRGGLCQGDLPCTVTSGKYASYWNAFLFALHSLRVNKRNK